MNQSPVYLFLGPETGEKGREVRALKEQFARDQGGNIESQVFYGFDDDLAAVLGDARNGSLFSQGRFLVFRAIEELRGSQDVVALEAYLRNPPPATVLVLESDEASSSRSSFMKKAASIIPKKAQKIFWEMFENQRQTWLISYIRENGGNISKPAAELILDLVSNNTEEMARECDKLLALHAGAGEITVDDVESYIFHSKEESPYTIFGYLAERNLGLALEALHTVLAQGEGQAIGLFAGLIRQFRTFAAIKADNPRGEPADDALKAHGVVFKRAQAAFRTACRNYSAAEAGRILKLAGSYEFALREFRSGLHSHLLQLFFYQAVVNGGVGSIVDPPVDEEGAGLFGLQADYSSV